MTESELEAALSQYAQNSESRRRQVEISLEEALPDVVQSIESTDVVITLRPTMMPLGQIDPEQFLKSMRDKFRLQLDPPKVISNIQQQMGDGAVWPDDKILQFALGQKDVDFSNGRVSVGQNAHVAISYVSLTHEKIIVTVGGRTEVAEYVAAEVFESMWFAAGAPKRWESNEVQRNVVLKSYGTRTKVHIGRNPLVLLAPSFLRCLESSLGQSGSLAAEMMSRSTYDKFAAAANVVSTFGLNELDFKVNVFNMITGRAEECLITIAIAARDDMGRGLLDIYTELPIEKHFELIGSIMASLDE